MNVNDISKKAPILPDSGTVQSRSSDRPAKAGKKSSESDQVQLSPQYQALAGKVAASDSFDTAKVEQIKAAIASGQFQVNADKIADGLISTVRDLLGK